MVKYFFQKKCNSENMARNVAAHFPPDLELQYTFTSKFLFFLNSVLESNVSGSLIIALVTLKPQFLTFWFFTSFLFLPVFNLFIHMFIKIFSRFQKGKDNVSFCLLVQL